MEENRAGLVKKSIMDAFSPGEIAQKAVGIGIAKTRQSMLATFLLAILAGAFIALGACFYTTVITQSTLGFGFTKLIGGLTFCLGLILVVLAGAELFTGNNLIIMAVADRKIGLGHLLRNWIVVYIGNFVGSVMTAVLVYYSLAWKGGEPTGSMQVGIKAYNIAGAKLSLTFGTALFAGILCNALVCLAVWLCYGARSTADKILAIIFPITAFVALGFEHSIANMYFIPYGMMLARTNEFITNAAGAIKYNPNIFTIHNFALNNLLPVTIGNIIGGTIMVGFMYWMIYLRGLAPAFSEIVAEERVEEPVER